MARKRLLHLSSVATQKDKHESFESLESVPRTALPQAGRGSASRAAPAVNVSRKAFEVSETQLRGGTVNLLTVLQAEQTLFTTENTLVQVRLSKLLAASSLFQALGGG